MGSDCVCCVHESIRSHYRVVVFMHGISNYMFLIIFKTKNMNLKTNNKVYIIRPMAQSYSHMPCYFFMCSSALLRAIISIKLFIRASSDFTCFNRMFDLKTNGVVRSSNTSQKLPWKYWLKNSVTALPHSFKVSKSLCTVLTSSFLQCLTFRAAWYVSWVIFRIWDCA